jgi:3D-(3,5/4)-trihydroxycyclohexane-1,2-dione acylhydrolase (decyclizing)
MTSTRRLTTAQALVAFLAAQEVERDGARWPFFAGMYGIFGHGNVAGLGEALEGNPVLRYRQARNEQAMVHAATAFARQHRRLRAFACTSSIGPGATNMLTGAATATVNRIPVLLLPGDLFATRRVAPVLQQLERPDSQDISVNDCFRPVSRYWDRINRPEQLIAALPEAMRVLLDPAETGAVTLALPQDVQAEAYDFPAALFAPRVHLVPRSRPDAELVARAVAAIAAARRPLLVAGGGVYYSDAAAVLDAFVGRTGIPVADTQAGKGSLPWDHPQYVGPLGATGGFAANRLARDADLVLVVGSRLSDFTTASKTVFEEPDVRFVAVNVAPFDAAKHAAIPLVGDARATLAELDAALAGRDYRVDPGYAATVATLRDAWNAEVDRVRAIPGEGRLSQNEVISIVNDSCGPGDVLVGASGGLPGDLQKLWRAAGPGAYHLEYGYSCMGYEIAGGMGAKLAVPEGEVVVMVGDGSYLMLANELATAAQEGIGYTVVLCDNHGFGCIDSLSRACGGTNAFNEFRFREGPDGTGYQGAPLPLDFVANARSLGAAAVRADDAASLRSALRAARGARRPTVIVVEVDGRVGVPDYEAWWDVPVAEVSPAPAVRAARERYVAARERERWFI